MTSPARAVRARRLALHPATEVPVLAAVTLLSVIGGIGGDAWSGPVGWLALAMLAGFSTSGST